MELFVTDPHILVHNQYSQLLDLSTLVFKSLICPPNHADFDHSHVFMSL